MENKKSSKPPTSILVGCWSSEILLSAVAIWVCIKKWWRYADGEVTCNCWPIHGKFLQVFGVLLKLSTSPVQNSQGTNSVAHTFLRSVRCGLAMQPWIHEHGLIIMERKQPMPIMTQTSNCGIIQPRCHTMFLASCKGRLQLHNFALGFLGFASGCCMCGMISPDLRWIWWPSCDPWSSSRQTMR